MNIITSARSEIVAAINSAGITAYGHTPATMVPPIVVVKPDAEWIIPNRVGSKLGAKIGFRIECVVNVIDSASALDALEDLVFRTVAAIPDGVLITSVDAPNVGGTGSQGDTLSTEILITAQIKE
jgi:hypothetical protein